MDMSSDRGSTPRRSTLLKCLKYLNFRHFLKLSDEGEKMTRKSRINRYICSAIILLYCIIYFPSTASILFLLAELLVLPLDSLRTFLREKLKLYGKVKILVVLVLILAGLAIAPVSRVESEMSEKLGIETTEETVAETAAE